MGKTSSAVVGLLVGLGLSAGHAAAQEPTPAQIHMGHVLEKFVNVPGDRGLLPVAVADARVAAQHATLGAQDPNNLQAMKLHARHVMHAIDPRVAESGPGSGYGLLDATVNLIRHIELASRATGATDGMRTHAVHVIASARNTERRADRVLALAQVIADHIDSAADAAALYGDLTMLAGQLFEGVDANGDGQIGWQEGEGGLQVVEQHVNFMNQAARGL